MNPTQIDTNPDDISVFLDVDGTLIEIADRPDAVIVPTFLPRLLADLHDRLSGAVALITGRPLAEIDRLLAPFRGAAAGQHGLEWRDASGHVDRASHEIEALDDVCARLSVFTRANPGCLLEHKGLTLALHYREAPETEAEARALVNAIMQDHNRELDAYDGKMVFEFKPAGTNKGSAVRRFMESPPFLGRQPIFIGDDTTDEYGFEAVRSLGGRAIIVGDRESERADIRIDSVPAVHALLARWADRSEWYTRISERSANE